MNRGPEHLLLLGHEMQCAAMAWQAGELTYQECASLHAKVSRALRDLLSSLYGDEP